MGVSVRHCLLQGDFIKDTKNEKRNECGMDRSLDNYVVLGS